MTPSAPSWPPWMPADHRHGGPGPGAGGLPGGFHAQASIEPERYCAWLSKANRTHRVAQRSPRWNDGCCGVRDHQRLGDLSGLVTPQSKVKRDWCPPGRRSCASVRGLATRARGWTVPPTVPAWPPRGPNPRRDPAPGRQVRGFAWWSAATSVRANADVSIGPVNRNECRIRAYAEFVSRTVGILGYPDTHVT